MLSLSFISLAFILIFSQMSAASQLCPSFSQFSSQTQAFFSQGCIILPQENEIHVEIPLEFNSSAENIIVSVKETNGEMAQFLITTDSNGSSQYKIKSISKDKSQEFPLSHAHTPLLLRIHAGIFSLIPQNSPLEISHTLIESSQYIFSIKTSQPKPPKSHSPRFLFSCPSDYFLVEDACAKTCPVSHYGEDGICKECPETCDTKCLSSTRCNPCAEHQFYFAEAEACLSQCPETFFHDTNNKICVRCVEGCLSCTSPDGLCNTNYFKTATLVNLMFSALLFSLIVMCTCCLNKNKKRQENSQPSSISSIGQQPRQEVQEIKTEENPEIIIEKPEKQEKPKGPYVVLNEEQEAQEANEEFDDGELQDRTRRKRLSNVGRSRLLSLSMSKPFIIDDGNEEKAISHDSVSKLYANSRIDSTSGEHAKHKRTLLDNRNESKLFLKSLLLNEENHLSRHLYYNSTDASPKISFRDASSPLSSLRRARGSLLGESISPVSMGFVRREGSFGTMLRQLELKEMTERTEIRESAGAIENNPVEEKEEEMERSRKMSNVEEESKGYKQDLSTSISQDRDGVFDQISCSICGLNKRDCVNQPCGHLVACFSCMEQFKESYGLCPKCKRLLNDIEKINVQH